MGIRAGGIRTGGIRAGESEGQAESSGPEVSEIQEESSGQEE